jgi:hypothetical protein
MKLNGFFPSLWVVFILNLLIESTKNLIDNEASIANVDGGGGGGGGGETGSGTFAILNC